MGFGLSGSWLAPQQRGKKRCTESSHLTSGSIPQETSVFVGADLEAQYNKHRMGDFVSKSGTESTGAVAVHPVRAGSWTSACIRAPVRVCVHLCRER